MSALVAATTIVRRAPIDVPGGWLRIIDLDTRTQRAVCPLPDALHRGRDPNPRGGLRGGRGIAAGQDRLAVAINDRILVLDPEWRVERVLSHPWMGGLHDVAADAEGIWAACADNDVVLRVDWEGALRDVWHWRQDPALRRALGHGWLPHFDTWADHRDPFGGGLRVDVGHVNAVALDGDALLVGLGWIRPPTKLRWPMVRARAVRAVRRVGLERAASGAVDRLRAMRPGWLGGGATAPAMVAVTPGNISMDATESRPGWTWAVVELSGGGPPRSRRRARLVTRQPAAAAPHHNAVPYGRLVVVADSATGRVLALDRASGAIEKSVQLPGARPFPRGVLQLNGNLFAVGTWRPLALMVVDLATECVTDVVPLPDDRGETTFALAEVPASFEDPSARLPATRAAWPIVGADASAA